MTTLAPAPAVQAATLIGNARASLPLALTPHVAPVRAAMMRRAAELLTDTDMAADALGAARGLERLVTLLGQGEGALEQAAELGALMADEVLRLDYLLNG